MNLIGALAGSLCAAGALLLVNGLTPTTPAPPKPQHPKMTKRSLTIVHRHVAAGTAVGVLVVVVSQWWAAGLLTAVAFVLVPMMRAERAAQVRDRERIAALAAWVESIRDLLAAASGIEEAIVRSAESLPPGSLIGEQVWRLRAVTETLGLREGLRRLGEDFADPIADYVTAALLVASERPSGAVHAQLSEAASNARESVSIRERVEASRARMWTTSATIGLISLTMVAFIVATQSTYAAWYSTVSGQIILLVCGGIELVAMVWMARMARPADGHRVVLFDPPTLTTGTPA